MTTDLLHPTTTTGLLRFVTAGSVDDGKSTLLGRLLHDTRSLFDDQVAAVEAVSAARGRQVADLALHTDGLRAEREQGITIDVAYRHFATARRRFIVADCPGHVQYTRNMVTGASTADVALILVDARHGLVEQSRRHASLCALLRVRRLVLVVNKMDLVGWSEAAFATIRDEFAGFAAGLGAAEPIAVPVSALLGDNVVERSVNTPWYAGPTLLELLERTPVAPEPHALRLPVQYVVRPQSHSHPDFRGYAGQIASGTLRVGDEVAVLPSGVRTTVAAIDTPAGPADEAGAPMAVTVRLADHIDISRGDLICHPAEPPRLTSVLEATICWMDAAAPLRAGARYLLKHTTRTARALVGELCHRLDVNTLHREPRPAQLVVNDLGCVHLRTTTPLAVDRYALNRVTGSLILIDEHTNATVAAGMITR